MALTEDERRKVLKMLEDLSDQKRTGVLASIEAFTNWLKSSLSQIYEKVKNALKNLWEKFCDAFA